MGGLDIASGKSYLFIPKLDDSYAVWLGPMYLPLLPLVPATRSLLDPCLVSAPITTRPSIRLMSGMFVVSAAVFVA